MRRKIYRAAAIATIISCIAMALFAWYAVGIIEKSNIEDTLEKRVDQVVKMLDKRQLEYERVIGRLYADYKAKARAMALILSENKDIMENETKFEELRMIVGAEVVTVTDQYMNVEYTTGAAGTKPEIYKGFADAINSKVFSEAIIDREEDTFKIAAGSSRIDKKGIVQIEFMSHNAEAFLDFTDISNVITDIPVMKSGCLGIIDTDTMNYIGHTSRSMVGKPSFFDMEDDLSNGNGDFIDFEINGEDVLLRYSLCKMGAVVGYVPYSEVYETRDDTTFWVVLAAIVIAVVVILAVRNRMLKSRNKKQA